MKKSKIFQVVALKAEIKFDLFPIVPYFAYCGERKKISKEPAEIKKLLLLCNNLILIL